MPMAGRLLRAKTRLCRRRMGAAGLRHGVGWESGHGHGTREGRTRLPGTRGGGQALPRTAAQMCRGSAGRSQESGNHRGFAGGAEELQPRCSVLQRRPAGKACVSWRVRTGVSLTHPFIIPPAPQPTPAAATSGACGWERGFSLSPSPTSHEERCPKGHMPRLVPEKSLAQDIIPLPSGLGS